MAPAEIDDSETAKNPMLDFTGSFVQIIDGKPSTTKETRHGVNPANMQPKEEVPVATQDDLDCAVDAARKAFRTWSKVPYEDRRAAVLAFADAVEKVKTAFRDLLVSEQGKPIPQADVETDFTIGLIRELAHIELPEEVIEDDDKRTVITRYVPIGVVGAIIPWNFPFLLAASKLIPALLTGNVAILKPSPFTPYCGLKLVELAQGFFPPGVAQSLSGDDRLGPWLTSHPGIDKISFTGSSTTGKLVLQSAAKTLKRVTLELGGNDPAIIFPDVDVDKVAEKVAFYSFLNSGQICIALKRIYVHESIYEQFRNAVVKQVKAYTLGDGFQEGISHGPLQNSMQYEKVKTFFKDIEKEGWKVAVGGKIDPSPGYFITPTVIDRPPDSSRIVVEEPFGPIVPLLSWKDVDDVIARANDSLMGLGASVWCNDLKKAERVARRIQAGSVWVNTHFDLSPMAPFGGHKESGLGVEWGKNGLKELCNVQTLFLNKHVVA
ncbi:Aldedh domain-containing protein [Fusarium falciforme]|uniref:Aldedh domain-containing protein n=1 Tax=Fusarium falciforme TaxID=195108 RepID=UPI002301152F|nr:Aldedh domain-containing protein [Fusarium falciforme]WAO97099.1 Aldedh domain-containing protein [Fusarium falciforme]